ncbi:hypothetical protein QTG54_013537 [Skeletonema marinoi]|uniref:Uncharacterized protein n=1 Tax=Skeletonema marinoi TaxID=267567 RepID=A0AAD8XXR3_9STRA|nr:hypothetical protein QTG54_013537 [Skeletonema marinoi]
MYNCYDLTTSKAKAGSLRENAGQEDNTIQARTRNRKLNRADQDEMCIDVPSMHPWYCSIPVFWERECAITEQYKMYQRLLDYSQDNDADKDEILGLFNLIFVLPAASMSGTAQSSLKLVLDDIEDYDKNCVARFVGMQFCFDNMLAGTSKLIKAIDIVSDSSTFLASLAVKGTVIAMAELIAESVASQYKDATGLFLSASEILKSAGKLLKEKQIMLLRGNLPRVCGQRT